MNYWVYVLKSRSTGKIYVGQTSNLTQRLARHNLELPSKTTSYTKLNIGPWDLVYKQNFITRLEAKTREKQLKSHQGRNFIKNKILNIGPVAQW